VFVKFSKSINQEQWTRNPKAADLNPARSQFLAMLISCSHDCSDGSMRLVAVLATLKPDSTFNVEI